MHPLVVFSDDVNGARMSFLMALLRSKGDNGLRKGSNLWTWVVGFAGLGFDDFDLGDLEEECPLEGDFEPVKYGFFGVSFSILTGGSGDSLDTRGDLGLLARSPANMDLSSFPSILTPRVLEDSKCFSHKLRQDGLWSLWCLHRTTSMT